MKISKLLIFTCLFICTIFNSACERGKIEVPLQQKNGDATNQLPYVTPKSVDLDPADSIKITLIFPGNMSEAAVVGSFLLGNTGQKRYFLLDTNDSKTRYYDQLIYDSNGDRNFRDDPVVPLSRGEFIASRNRHFVEFDPVNLSYLFQSPKKQIREQLNGKLYFWQPVRGLPTTAHFLRNSWREGVFECDEQQFRIILIDDDCNGLFDARDSWAIFHNDSLNFATVHFNNFRELSSLAWSGQTAFEIVKIDEGGHRIILQKVQPEFSREEDLGRDNPYMEEPQRPRAARDINWLTSLKKAKRKARRARKPLLIKFSTRWSGPCITMDERTYRDAEIVSLSDKFVCLHLDGDRENTTAKAYDVTRFPTTIILDSRGREISRAIGYQPATEFSAYLAQFVK